MARPEVTEWTETLYGLLEPWAVDDEANDWALLKLCEAVGIMTFEVEELAAPGDDDEPGWRKLLDLDEAAASSSALKVLPWLGQFVGVGRIQRFGGETDEQFVTRYRDTIAARLGFIRGTPAALVQVARDYLNEPKRAVVVERAGGNAYHVQVAIYEDDAPADTTALESALQNAKGAGLILEVIYVAGYSWTEFEADVATWADAPSEFEDWDDAEDGP